MAEKSVFERLDDISAGQAAILSEITGVKTQMDDSDDRIATLEKEIQNLKRQNAQPNQVIIDDPKPEPSEQEILQQFLKQAKKSWRWFGPMKEFRKWKTLTILSLTILLMVGLATTIVSSICFKIYSTFTLFENIWMAFCVAYLAYASKTQLTYEVNAFATNSSTKFRTDNLGMKFPIKEKGVYRVFKWFAVISVFCNVICIWGGMGKDNQLLATVMELLFLGAIIFASLINLNFYSKYLIIWVEGNNLTTKEKVVLVLPPGEQQLMPEEDFKKKYPIYYE